MPREHWSKGQFAANAKVNACAFSTKAYWLKTLLQPMSSLSGMLAALPVVNVCGLNCKIAWYCVGAQASHVCVAHIMQVRHDANGDASLQMGSTCLQSLLVSREHLFTCSAFQASMICANSCRAGTDPHGLLGSEPQCAEGNSKRLRKHRWVCLAKCGD